MVWYGSGGDDEAQKSTLHRNLGSFSGGPDSLSKGTFTIPSISSSSSKSLAVFSFRALPAMFSSEGGKRILASTKGADTNREFSKALGETRSWRQLSEEMSEELRGTPCLVA
jgi:hypothetical protein